VRPWFRCSRCADSGMKLFFFALSGSDVGYGHLNRCLSIAECASRQGLQTTFYVLGEGADIPRSQGYEAVQVIWPGAIPTFPFGEEAVQRIAVLDVAHPSVFSMLPELVGLIESVRKFAHKLVIIDSLGSNSFVAALPLISVNAVVVPYVGGSVTRRTSATMLVGPEYALLSSDYASLPVRQINIKAERILVSFGGSDPKALTAAVFEALARIRRKLVVRVVIGPLFDPRLTDLVEANARRLHHDMVLVYSPHGLIEHMQWADIAVVGSGLVKYELAATGTPGILISIDEAHDQANKPFARERLQRDLGVTNDPVLIGLAIEELLDSADARRGMAERGQRLIDGKGVERLIAAFTRLH
jgi:UDP-2,4-diacetamido-2,4,6-trideoxy-beta-L-altropyranose hydrolase